VLSLQGSQREHELSQARDYAEAIVETVREPLVVLDGTFRVRTVNSAFCRTFRLGAADSVGKSLYDLGEGQWKIPRLRTLLEEVLRDGPQFEGFEVEHDFPLIGPRTMMLNARRIEAGDGRDALILLAMEDVTRQREATRSGH
jgi:PAS domain S-box-containing protein